MALRYKAAKGFLWHFGATSAWKIIDFITSIILARLLIPEDFGVMAICYLVTYFLFIFSNFGMSSYIIQKKNNNKDELDTAFFLSIFFGLIMYLIIYLISPLISNFYGLPQITWMIRILSLSLIISSFDKIPFAIKEKNLDYKSLVYPRVLPWIVYLIISVGLTLLNYRVWSLIIGYLSMSVSKFILIWIVSDYRPNFNFNKEYAKESLLFGKDIVLYALLTFFILYGVEGYVGKIFGTVSLGYFTIANKFSTLMSKNITRILNRIMFSTFSTIQDNLKQIKESFIKVFEYACLLIIPALLGIFILSPEIITILYTNKWMEAIPLLRLLVISGIAMSIGNLTNSVLLATKKQNILSKIKIFQIIILISTIHPFSKIFGLKGVAYSLILSFIVKSIFDFYATTKILDLELLRMIKDLSYIPLSSLLMGVSILVLKIYINISNIFLLGFTMIFGLMIYVISLYVVNKSIFRRIIKFYFNFKKTL
ncbi:lipopolysaccharide biosynthesis protein [archaeon]|jgi:O-antigen/teichoic acid export membrane protein|nr:lipopolysaccharide biosynthesis protein [Candidatus Woesearchaeota archaeon]MBT3464352.1 lipopolysaccharide biosynthesis protein [archaeon]MBT4351878.1 lipopolysaccharide biosynthesis protein [archaeon]MBT4647982.1 lipopolysaccharide biosynthesis protein [archaeon]MBT6822647.1 lipopolysaccharide biosynthesis protein [archaeon]